MFVPLQSPPPCVSSLPPWPPVDVWSGPGLYRVHLLCPLPEDTLTTGGEKSTFFPRRIFLHLQCEVLMEVYRVQSVPQSHFAGDESVSQVVIFLLKAETGLLETKVFPLKNNLSVRPRYCDAHDTTRPNPSPQKLSDQVFVHRVFIFALTVHYLEPTLLQLGFL